ncbi:MAG: DUF1385 domain-containing protein [Proteobacteria bacterium]|nr:DUF1385 domain-containing protein [Pseudomonadota bacterium]MBU1611149.1 DUF1385 domain-containing protein [Pseudomonadota bacterium]
MMRAKNMLAIAVRKPDGEIKVELRPWFSLTSHPLLKKPFLRGFPVLLETLVNGIKALNFSATESVPEEEQEEGGGLTAWHLALTMVVALSFALGLFVVLPHFFSVGMEYLGLAGDVDTISFHIWDGVFKLSLFIGYILAISLIPDIRRVFQYHGAEHKTIWAYETGVPLTPANASLHSRLHPRCGTAFLLFVLAISIVLFTVLVPLMLIPWTPENFIVKHMYIVGVKFALMVPVSSLAYELIKFAGKFHKNILCRMMCWPGLAMQALTTKEPDDAQLEVAIAALKCALGEEGC